MAATPTLAFTPIATQTFGATPFRVSATSASSGAVTYSVTSGPATISGSTVTVTGIGTVVLGASQAANGNYGAATATTSFSVVAATPTLAFTPIVTQTYGATPFGVSATSASSGAVTYSVTSGPATISGSTVTLTGVGTVVLGASQAANGNYGAATATTNFTVVAATPTLAFTPIATQTFGATPFTVSATSASSGAVTYSVVSGPATISGNTVTITGAGTIVVGAAQAATGNYTSATAQVSVNVAPATPTLSFTSIPTQSYGNAPFSINASSASNGTVTYSVVSGPATVSGSTVTITGVGVITLNASQAATTNYTGATTQTTVSVSQGTPNLVFANVPAQTYGNQPFNVSASSASPGQVSYSVQSGPATISNNTVTITGVGKVSLAASQAATANYTAANAQTSFDVSPATPALTFAAIPPQTFGNPPFQVNASSASSGNVTYSIVSGPGVIVGNIITMTGTGTIVIGASQAATTNYTSASAQVSAFVDASSTTTQKLVPIEVLDPTSQGSLSLSGSANLKVVGGPQVGLEINSSAASAFSCTGNANIDVSNGGPNFTGSAVDIVGGPVSPPGGCFSAGSTGGWNADSSSITDPFASVSSPTQPALSTTASGPHTVAYQQDGCPYNNAAGCGELEPGYYPSGINLGGNPVIIFKPGIYFLGGNIQIGGGVFRPATPCAPSCSQYSILQGAATDGVLFYFTSGSGLVLAGNSGKAMKDVDSFPSTSLSCNGSAPPAELNAPSMLSGNVLLAQCSAQGTYIGPPSTDFATANGFRGLLVFTDRNANNPTTKFSGSGSMALAGVVYVHTNQNTGLVDFSGSSGTSSYVVGDFVVDDLNLSGSGSIAISLSNNP